MAFLNVFIGIAFMRICTMPNQLLKFIDEDNYADAEALVNNATAVELLELMANPDEDGMLPIHAVTDFSSYDKLSEEVQASLNDLAILLVEKGAKLDIRYEGLLPIHYVCASQNGSLMVLQAILATGFDPNAQDIVGETALHHAIKAGVSHKNIIEYLLALPNLEMLTTIAELGPKSPLDYAHQYYPEIASSVADYRKRNIIVDEQPRAMLEQYKTVVEEQRNMPRIQVMKKVFL